MFPQHGTAWSDLSLMYHKPPKCSCCAVMNDFSNFPSVFSSSFFKGSFGLATFILLWNNWVLVETKSHLFDIHCCRVCVEDDVMAVSWGVTMKPHLHWGVTICSGKDEIEKSTWYHKHIQSSRAKLYQAAKLSHELQQPLQVRRKDEGFTEPGEKMKPARRGTQHLQVPHWSDGGDMRPQK